MMINHIIIIVYLFIFMKNNKILIKYFNYNNVYKYLIVYLIIKINYY